MEDSQVTEIARAELDDELGDETVIALFAAYEEVFAEDRRRMLPPHMNDLYPRFKKHWIKRMMDFIASNPDLWEIPENVKLEDVEGMMEAQGFPIPSQNHLHDALNFFGMNYISAQGFWANVGVVEVW